MATKCTTNTPLPGNPNCEDCPLNGQPKVFGQIVSNPELVIVGEGPGHNEELKGQPFVGASGRLLWQTLAKVKVFRSECLVTNALCCRPKLGVKLKPTEWTKALECCKSRLEHELFGTNKVRKLALGAKALQALTGKAKITPWLGSPLEGPYGEVVPNLHPAFCLARKPSFIPVFKHITVRAVSINWKRIEDDALIAIDPELGMLSALQTLTESQGTIGVDVETAGIDPVEDDLLCIGFGTKDTAVSVPFPIEDQAIASRVRLLIEHPGIKLAMHNGQHDVLALEAHGYNVQGYEFDTLLAHAVVANQLPHDLGLVCALELNNERWKTEYRVESDAKGSARFVSGSELRLYNAKDSIQTGRLVEPLTRQLSNTHNGESLFYELMKLNSIATEMRRIGILTDTKAFAEHYEILSKREHEARTAFHAMTKQQYKLGKNGLHKSLRELFFNKLGMQPKKYSPETREPCLDAETLESYKAEGNPVVEELSDLVLKVRKATKLRATYLDGLPRDENNVVHANWRLGYGAITGRSSCNSPNLMNQPKGMRNMYVPRKGLWMAAADWSALEYRIMANFYKVDEWLQWFDEGKDMHMMNAELFFGDSFKAADEKGRKHLRTISKGSTYAWAYGAEPETAWRVAYTRDRSAKLGLYKQIFRKLDKMYPTVKSQQRELVARAQETGFVEEQVSGRREYFHNGQVEMNKVLNFPIQGCAASRKNKALLDLWRLLDRNAGEMLLAEIHDELLIEGPDPKRLTNMLISAMTSPFDTPWGSIVFPVDVDLGQSNWRDLEQIS